MNKTIGLAQKYGDKYGLEWRWLPSLCCRHGGYYTVNQLFEVAEEALFYELEADLKAIVRRESKVVEYNRRVYARQQERERHQKNAILVVPKGDKNQAETESCNSNVKGNTSVVDICDDATIRVDALRRRKILNCRQSRPFRLHQDSIQQKRARIDNDKEGPASKKHAYYVSENSEDPKGSQDLFSSD
ncbi:uncharacterized protein KY384_008825 [Bacidia gigantensis]|uniref:uncharacterized protein n=1 Tax=Bacidia gigantensis TaxID=2732470 RepID=UPI001D05A1C9|nr:uncharacterized protein KY384_008825 [Bacidia gigantensis]KAG8526624.1 hypothetical protein KY384_008825 [Bacidia gigantensis]